MRVPADAGEVLCGSDRPCSVEGHAHMVVLTVPDLGSFPMTPDAALETAHRLMEAGLQAKRRAC